MPKFPTVGRLKAWETELYAKVRAASFRADDLSIKWLKAVKDPDADLDSLRGNPVQYPWPILNNFLSDALIKMVGTQGEFSTTLSRLNQEEIKTYEVMLNGRQILWLLYKHLSTSEDLIQVYDMLNLQKIKYHGDDFMSQFIDQWVDVSMNMRDDVSDDTLALLLLEQIKDSPELKSDIDHYRRVDNNHKDHSFEYLLGCLKRRVALKGGDQPGEAQ